MQKIEDAIRELLESLVDLEYEAQLRDIMILIEDYVYDACSEAVFMECGR